MPHLMKRRSTILIILALVGITSVALFSFLGNKNSQEDNIIVRTDSAWIYPFSSAEELLNDSNVHLVVEATVLPNSRSYQIINEEPPRIVLNRTLTDIKVERIFKDTRGGVNVNQTIPIIETTSIKQDKELGKTVETPLEFYRKAETGLKYLFLLHWNSKEQKYHIAAAHYGKYNLDNKDGREIAVEKDYEPYGKIKKDMVANYRSILSKN